ncbi:MAG: hypothetical protein PHR81_08015 [Bacteroidales bacterium]|jgi:hypothetical protein|nr:hypothetical protein [Bacteroidales bacterium]MDD4214738.1 hypothetical protein [Bacteroidales bacterium]
MKKILLVSFAVLMLFVLSSCNKLEKQIVGTWTKSVLSVTLTAVFSDGGSITLTWGAYNTNGVYSLDDNELTITTNDCVPVGVYTIAIDGDAMTLVKVSDDCDGRKDLLAGVFNNN